VKCAEDGEQLLIFLLGYTPAHGLNSNGVSVSSIGVIKIYPIFHHAAVTKDMGDSRPGQLQNPIRGE
jgi:hypothetical protein